MIELPALNQSLLNGGQLFVFVYRPNFTARPDVQLSLGSNLLASNIKEGDDVYFDCRASALPPVTRLEWFHNVSYSLDRCRLSSRAYNLLNKRLPSSSKFNLCFLSFPKCFGRRQEKKLNHNISAGVITTNQSLVLQRVGRHSAGRYRCSATNREGETESDVFHLNVKCKIFRPIPWSQFCVPFPSFHFNERVGSLWNRMGVWQ